MSEKKQEKGHWEILPHPAHSTDQAPSDFHLFGPLKRHLGGMAFETEDDLISELRNWFDNLDVDFFRVGINSLLSRWQKCIDLHRDYVENPDQAPSDFHLFRPLKRHLGGMAFETEDDLIIELRNWFDNLDVDFFRVGINSLLSRWQKCIDLHGDYVEK
ncbi:histone-lysine N-methyltransferase SETMAR [Plakobranchus ocellatus]|uniref:Histone-lysine N-methyltransferase SETMAR n=1 Tax=Plakobranchus ocellatus TaxID=259542 RepID=A0AAV3YIJ8_9GAST|nr:histone-lysine N-methyltransferase SETMAR [Plakobranchus ocellatus]